MQNTLAVISIYDIIKSLPTKKCKSLNTKNKKTLNAIFEDPISSDIRFDDVKKLIKSLGGKIKEGRGSRVMFELNGKIGRFHEPHPNPEIKRYVVKDLRDFLEVAGCLPEE